MASEIVWESPKKNKLGQPFLTVKQEGRYYFSERAGIDSVAFILYDRKIDKFCAVNERKPPLDETKEDNKAFLVTAFGGSLDEADCTPLEIVIREAKEESGSDITADDILSLGSVMVSTQSNQFCHLYLVFVNADKMGDTDPQNEIEAEATLEWFDKSDYCNYQDWKLITIIAKATALKEI